MIVFFNVKQDQREGLWAKLYKNRSDLFIKKTSK